MRKTMAILALTILTACDYAERIDMRNERADRLYQSAMDDYRSGRIDAAIAGFGKTVARDPANASARFQLACLQQDAKRDYLNAYCGYREYLLQRPSADKSPLARTRLAICEKELAKELARKHGLLGGEGLAREVESAHADLKAAETRIATAEKELEALRGRMASLTADRDRLLKIVKGGGEEPAGRPSAKEAKDLLEEEDDVDRIRISADVASLKSEEKDENSSSSSLLPVQTADDRKRRDAAVEVKERKPSGPVVPETYVVEEGDTLYRVSKRFYGTLSAWRKIKDANKALISADNRLRAGDTLKLPRP